MTNRTGSTGHDCECCEHIWISPDKRLCDECEKHIAPLEAVSAELAKAIGAILPFLEIVDMPETRFEDMVKALSASFYKYQRLEQTKGTNNAEK